jgi:acyl carrier protein phosphodiesterase
MNFLSHLHLSGDSEGLIIGNYIADSVKGSAYNKFSHEIQQGILLHRKIDTFTDTHPIVEQSKKRLREKYKKYSSVIVDIYYDHYLAINWKDYSTVDLQDFSNNIYKIVERHHDIFPKKSQRFTSYMMQYNILYAYSTLDGIEQVLKGMACRSIFESKMEYAIEDLKEHYHLFGEEFKSFYPELKRYVNMETEML